MQFLFQHWALNSSVKGFIFIQIPPHRMAIIEALELTDDNAVGESIPGTLIIGVASEDNHFQMKIISNILQNTIF